MKFVSTNIIGLQPLPESEVDLSVNRGVLGYFTIFNHS